MSLIETCEYCGYQMSPMATWVLEEPELGKDLHIHVCGLRECEEEAEKDGYEEER